MAVVFSGVQPSSCTLHLGNYLGAVRKWVELQHLHSCFFCIVDLHALTSNCFAGSGLRSNAISLFATYIACGIDPKHATVFMQSSVPEHSELCWILHCITPTGWINRMTQFKEKSRSGLESGMGLYCYPILMASDILLYKTDLVPVGSDQQQHMELTQDIAKAFNLAYKVDYFTIPKPVYDTVPRIMSLKDGTKKMSKSDPSVLSCISLNDEDDIIVQKIRKATTDSTLGFTLESLESRPEVHNLINIFSALAEEKVEAVCNKFKGCGTKQFKDALSDLLISKISPIRKRTNMLLCDKEYVLKELTKGNDAATAVAHRHMKEIKEIVGLT